MQHLVLKGVRQNNLKSINLELPLGQTIVVTGPSGSGKSSLAFETVYAEGQRRYMQSLSTYARQFLERFKAPDAESIRNIPPTIALEQINPVRNSRATVATSTEIYDYLRLLFEKVGTEYCPKCNTPMQQKTLSKWVDSILEGFSQTDVIISFKKSLPTDKKTAQLFLEELLKNGYSRTIWKSTIVSTEDLVSLKDVCGKEIDFVVDRVSVTGKSASIQGRLSEALGTSLSLGNGLAYLWTGSRDSLTQQELITEQSHCLKCGLLSPPKTAASFSFNSPLGACQKCKGFGNILQVDPELVVPNPNLTLAQGAIDPFIKPSLKHWQKKMLQFCKAQRIDADLPYRELSSENKRMLFEGHKGFIGVRGVFGLLEKDRYKMGVRVLISRYNSPFLCLECKGSRLNSQGLLVKVGERNIADIVDSTVDDALLFLKSVGFSAKQKQISKEVLNQLFRRLETLSTVGVGYLTLSRLTRSLSGGEYQRILLSTQLSQGLTETLYVLDEPSIGLHPKDTQRLLEVLGRLRHQGNTLLIVEHDPEIIHWGDHIIDMGPGSGFRGGEVVFQGTRERFLLQDSLTASAVKNWKEECRKTAAKPLPAQHSQWVEILGARGNNLKNVDVKFPLKALVAVTGVSGSGKSTLVVDTLYQALTKLFFGRSEKIARFESIRGFEHLTSVQLVDQTPIGKSSRSNPITFMKAFDEVRTLFSETPLAEKYGLSAGHFSFNIPGGRCETCEGEGRVTVDMVFMEDVYVPCQVCNGKRFKPRVLEVRYRGKNIYECLQMTVDEAYTFFSTSQTLRSRLAVLQEVGLGYIQLGQPGFSLSGGESQRLKIAKELSHGRISAKPTLFILDEPTTGLHFTEITRLIQIFRRLVQAGHSVIVIEHNLQMIAASQYIVDLGPDGGKAGGTVVGMGTPKELALKKLAHTGLYLAEILGESQL